MKSFVHQIQKAHCKLKVFKNNEGQGMIEYVLIIALIAIAVVGATQLLGDEVNTVMENITGTLSGAGTITPTP